MPWSAEFMTLAKSALVEAVVKSAGSCLLGGAVLWWVAVNVGPRTGTAVVHVTEPGVVVAVGDQTRRVGVVNGEPLVIELEAGEHWLRMRRGPVLLYEERFRLPAGEEVVLTAWCPSCARQGRTGP
jgi:hypothetical protein